MKFSISNDKFYFRTGSQSELTRALKRSVAYIAVSELGGTSVPDLASKITAHLCSEYHVSESDITITSLEVGRSRGWAELALKERAYHRIFAESIRKKCERVRKQHLAKLKRSRKPKEPRMAAVTAKNVIVRCFDVGRSRIRVYPLGGQGLAVLYVSFPKNLRSNGTKYRVETLMLAPSGKHYRASGKITKVK